MPDGAPGLPVPDALRSAAEFVDGLRFVRARSGLTFRKLSARAAAVGDSLPTSTIASVLSRSTLPRRDVVTAFLRACGLDEATVTAWVVARDALSVSPANPATSDAPDDGQLGGPAMLPPDIADFTGRDDEATILLAALTRPEPQPRRALPIGGVCGMGGAGKSTLAVHVAHRVADFYPDGQLWVNLRGAEPDPVSAGDALAQLLRALGVPDRAVPASTAERSGLFRTRTAGRRLLVVLDNAASEEQVRQLLPGSGSCGVLLTSRARLDGLDAVRWVALSGFAPAESIRLLRRVVGDRVGADVDGAARIAGLCADLPLAMRIAGARLAARPAWRLANLADLLDDERRRLDHLTAGDLAVRATLRLSYQALDEPTRRLFRLLGLFDAPDFAGWLAAAVLRCQLDDATEHLEALVDAQLLEALPVDRAGQFRYRFHDLVRLYAQERAHAEESETALRRTIELGLGGWLALAERLATSVPGPCYAPLHGAAPRPPLEWADTCTLGIDPQDWFDAERVALAFAVRQACRHDLDELAFDLAGCLEKYFDLRGMYAEWKALNTVALATCRRNGNRLGEATMRRGLLDVNTWIGDQSSADAMTNLLLEGQQLLALFTDLGHEPAAADTAVMCAWALAARGEVEQAVAMVMHALQLAEHSRHLGGQVRARLALALAHHEGRDYQTSLGQAQLALDKARQLGNPRAEATALQFVGIGHRELHEFDSGERSLESSVAICRQHRDYYTEALSLLALARLYLMRGDTRMRATAQTALTMSRRYQMSHHIADSHLVLGEIELMGGDHTAAAAHLRASVAIWRTRGWYSFHAAALVSLGRALVHLDEEGARRSFTEASDLFTRLGRTAAADEAHRLAGDLLGTR